MTTEDRTRLKPVTRDQPCVICQGTHKCSRGDDGFILCGRPVEPAPSGYVYMGRSKKDEQFGQYRAVGDPVLETRQEEWKRANGKRQQAIDWNQRARQYANALTPDRREELAKALWLPASAINAFALIGWSDGNANDEPSWTLPEFDANTNVVGLIRRYLDGSKRAMAGGGRGLTVAEHWDRGDDVFLFEGFSDTAAAGAIGLSALGRPNNLGGVEQLAAMLKNGFEDRNIVVVGEIDMKSDGSCPGLDGAKRTAANLAKLLGRPVLWALPPGGAKDLRRWVLDRIAEGATLDKQLGAAFVAALKPQGSKPEEAKPLGYAFEPINSAEFAAADYRQEWLVKRCLVAGQVAVLGGGKKSLKTTVAVDLALSLGTGAAFLGQFEVYRKLRVAVISGESGEFTLQETARRVAAAKGIELAAADVVWDFSLPQLSRSSDLTALAAGLKANAVEALIFDPLYLALLAGSTDVNAGNLYEIGPLLATFTRACLDAGVTPHHFRKASAVSDDLDLNALAFAGIGEFTRQWLLIGRREAYVAGSGIHKLTMVVGGSAGQSGSWSLDVDEGQLADDFTGRKWDVQVEPTVKTRQDASLVMQQKRKEKNAENLRAVDAEFLNKLDAIIASGKPATKTAVRDALNWNGTKANGCVTRLELDGIIEKYPAPVGLGNGAKKGADCLRRKHAD